MGSPERRRIVVTNVLVVYASRHGGSRDIAGRIGEVLRAEGIDASVAPAEEAGDPSQADGVVIGSGVYMGSWLDAGLKFMERNVAALGTRPVWLFSSGPLRGSSAEKEGVDPLEAALGPEEGPGSGGRRKVTELATAIHAREHRIFYGAFDPNDPPRGIPERLIRMMPGSSKLLPEGDFRDWDAIEAWAHDIAASLGGRVDVA
jgi:menaquinone-dependent protoporphyrinogen oxidase